MIRYEILALEVRLVVCGALVPIAGNQGLRISAIVLIMITWTMFTLVARPYINRGHATLLGLLQLCQVRSPPRRVSLATRLPTPRPAPESC